MICTVHTHWNDLEGSKEIAQFQNVFQIENLVHSKYNDLGNQLHKLRRQRGNITESRWNHFQDWELGGFLTGSTSKASME